jgi:hypothetical protein
LQYLYTPLKNYVCRLCFLLMFRCCPRVRSSCWFGYLVSSSKKVFADLHQDAHRYRNPLKGRLGNLGLLSNPTNKKYRPNFALIIS